MLLRDLWKWRKHEKTLWKLQANNCGAVKNSVIYSGWGLKDFWLPEQKGLGQVSAEPTEQANMKPDKHMGHIDTTTTARECSVWPRRSLQDPYPILSHLDKVWGDSPGSCICPLPLPVLFCTSPQSSSFPRLALATSSCFSAGQTNTGPCSIAMATRAGLLW